jgi:hypothetical protein
MEPALRLPPEESERAHQRLEQIAAGAGFAGGANLETLRRQFGAQYEGYARAAPRWWPRLRPWTPPEGQRREPRG